MSNKSYRIEDGSKFKLSSIDPSDDGKFKNREECEAATAVLTEELLKLQETFYVDGRRALLIVFQAMDTGGKDGAIRQCFRGLNPIGTQVTSFKRPSTEEMSHDFLWRIHKAVPAKSKFGIFNRSHYEDVLVVRVHDLIPKKDWKERYAHINNFEKSLSEENTVILKFFLHISKDEQKQRLEERLADPAKHWKFEPGDLKERTFWDDYMEAYEDAVSKCSAPWAPWYVVPSNKKWYRNYVITDALVKTLSKIEMNYPKAVFNPAEMKVV